MNVQSTVLALAADSIAAVERAEAALPSSALDSPSSWETWNAADALTHCAEWLSKDQSRLGNPGELIPIIGSQELEEMNREYYEKHRGSDWKTARSYFTHKVEGIRQIIEADEDPDLSRLLHYSDGRTRPLWWGVSGHLGLHVGWHLGIILRRHELASLSVELVQDFVSRSLSLSDDPTWRSANHYDLAVAYAQASRPEEAVEELKKSFSLFPPNRDIAPEDDDLTPLWNRADFVAITRD